MSAKRGLGEWRGELERHTFWELMFQHLDELWGFGRELELFFSLTTWHDSCVKRQLFEVFFFSCSLLRQRAFKEEACEFIA